MELRILDQRDEWAEVELAGGRRGWLTSDALLDLTAP
jgi:uncharacterized protein YgiM (DUF1202 family)